MKRVHFYQQIFSLISLSMLLSACGTARVEPTPTNRPAVPATDAPAAAPTASETPSTTPSPVPTMSGDEFMARQNPVERVEWSADGQTLIVAALFSGVYSFDVQSNPAAHLIEASKEFGSPMAFNQSENLLLIGDHVVDLVTGKVRYQIKNEAYSRSKFSPNGKTLAISMGNSIALWDAATGKFQKEIAEGIGTPWDGLSFSADGSRLYAVYADGQVRQVDLGTGKASEIFHLPEGGCCGDFSTDSATVLLNLPNHGGGHKELWDVKSQKTLITLEHCDSDVTLTAFSADSKYVVTGPCGADAQLWDIQGQKIIHSFPSHAVDDYPLDWRSAAFSPDGSKLALGNDIGEVAIWDLTSYQLLQTLSMPKATP